MNINTLIEEERKLFEANMLDGNNIDDCGKAIIDAKECLIYFEERFKEVVSKSFEAVRGEEKEYRDFPNGYNTGEEIGFNSALSSQQERERNFLK